MINHTNADVRKCCVFCLVEIHTVLTLNDPHSQLFASEFQAKLNPSQKKLVDIYIKRKLDLAAQSSKQNPLGQYLGVSANGLMK